MVLGAIEDKSIELKDKVEKQNEEIIQYNKSLDMTTRELNDLRKSHE